MKVFNKFKTFLLTLFVVSPLYPALAKTPDYAPVQAVDTKTIYLQTSDNWRSDDAQFAAYVWVKPNVTPHWYPMSPLTNAEDEAFFSVDIPVTPYNAIIFTRMNSSADPANYSWSNSWNQTSDLDLDFESSNNLYIINEGSWGSGSEEVGYWSEYLPTIIDPNPDPDPNQSAPVKYL